MTNKGFYGDKLLAVALEDACGTFHRVVHGKNCGGKNCEDCEFSTVESIENWLNAEHVEPEPQLLKNGDGLKPGDWIMVSVDGINFVKRQFLFFRDGIFYTTANDEVLRYTGTYTNWTYTRLPMEGE